MATSFVAVRRGSAPDHTASHGTHRSSTTSDSTLGARRQRTRVLPGCGQRDRAVYPLTRTKVLVTVRSLANESAGATAFTRCRGGRIRRGNTGSGPKLFQPGEEGSWSRDAAQVGSADCGCSSFGRSQPVFRRAPPLALRSPRPGVSLPCPEHGGLTSCPPVLDVNGIVAVTRQVATPARGCYCCRKVGQRKLRS
jgi:hypothetical protein